MTVGSQSPVWYVARGGQRYGPISEIEFSTLHREGHLAADDLVWRDGQKDWLSFAALEKTLEPTPAVERTNGLLKAYKRALKSPLQFVTTAYQLIAQPDKFAQTRIDQHGRDLGRSVWFFLNSFSIVILVSGSFTYLQYYSGLSQPRELAAVVVQILFALPFLYAATLLSKASVPLRGIVQAVLYIDAAYLMTSNAIGIAVAAVTNEIGSRDIDIFGSEYERCLASGSIVYWTLRGDLSFFSRPLWLGSDHLSLLKDNLIYIVVVPFCILFGQLLYKRYGTSRNLMSIAALVAFVAVVQGHARATDAITSAIANKSDCFTRSVQTAQNRYNRTVLAQQAANSINSQFSGWVKAERRVVHVTSEGLTMRFLVQQDEVNEQLRPAGLIYETSRLYCDERTSFRYAKWMREILTVDIIDSQHQLLFRQRISPDNCSTLAATQAIPNKK